ncbi:uncharacterized protein LOC116719975 isoform X8 [Xiphophorus hellerii]|uniref:uncharacterized protein LOC116719975 isoform X8 n=1 Tax=Xiphophorus hellerii TaxID=8084 RepID=UPI0013B46130|nr:uncharacterized protein LOC116719975 isoform X8 [Xiphophorus hellerii]
MNLYFGRRDRLNQEMASSLPASLFLLSVVFCQFVSAADQNNVKIKATVGESVILPCKDPDQEEIIVAEWNRTDLKSGFVLLYRDSQFDPANQDPSYRNRVDLLVGQIQKRDFSLILQNTTTDDSGTYKCHVVKSDLMKKRISSVSLVVAPPPPEPFPVWATVLLVLLVAAAIYYLFHWSPIQQVEVEPGRESVLLLLKVPRCLWFCKYRIFQHVAKVEWKDEYNRTVHVYPNGSDQSGEQDLIYRTRTKMDENLLKTGDLSLTLKWPTERDEKIFTCRVYNRKGEKLMEKHVWLKVKVLQQVEVESGKESVLLPCRTREDLDGDVKVEWKDRFDRTVHVYQNGSDQPGEQDEFYRTRTKMDENLLKNKNLSLTLSRPTRRDEGIFSCIVFNRDGDILMVRRIWLDVEVQQVEVESGVESVLLPCRTTENLDGDVKVEWKDRFDRTVHVYQNGSDQPREQNQIYRTRTKMDENLLKTKNLSLTLRRPRGEDRGTFTCSLYNRNGDVLMMKDVWLWVKVPEVEVETGEESVLLPWRTRENLDGDVKVEWKYMDNRTVHVYQNGSDQPREQNQIYRTRTKMDENLLKNKNLSLTLRWPTGRDGGIFTCSVYNRDGVMLMKKQINLKVKALQVEVETGEESVLLPWRITENLDGDVKVEWKDKDDRTVHVYQNGSDQPGEQNQFYRTRTKMDENLLENKDLSLTLNRPTERDRGIYTCSVYRDGVVLMKKDVVLWVEAGTDRVQPEDTRTGSNSIDQPLLGDQLV